MKYFFLFLISIHSIASWAMPTVGDYAKLSFSNISESESTSGTVEKTLTEYNAVTDTFVQSQTTTYNDGRKPETIETWEKTSDLASDQSIEALFNPCRNLEVLQTPAGIFPSCKLSPGGFNPPGSGVWVGKVPFGLLKSKLTVNFGPGMSVEMSYELVAFKDGAAPLAFPQN